MVGRLGLHASSCLHWRDHRLRNLFDGINPLKATCRGDDLNRCGDTVGFCGCRIFRCFFAAVLGTIIWSLLVSFSVSNFNDRIGFFALSLFSFAALLSLILLRSPAFGGTVVIIYLIAVIAGTDIGAYFAGRSIGGPKLAPAISPNKTWAGLIGGTIAAGLVGLLFFYTLALGGKDIAVLGVFGHEAAAAFAASCLIAPLAQSGDLMESWIKRRRGIKDSGNLIPGHGGILDRVDGYLTAAPAIVVIAIMHKEGGVVWP